MGTDEREMGWLRLDGLNFKYQSRCVLMLHSKLSKTDCFLPDGKKWEATFYVNKKRKKKKGILKEKPEPIVPLTSMPLEKTQKIQREEKTHIVE